MSVSLKDGQLELTVFAFLGFGARDIRTPIRVKHLTANPAPAQPRREKLNFTFQTDGIRQALAKAQRLP